MSSAEASVRVDALSRVFLWSGSPATTATLVGVLLALGALGIFLPQELTADALAESTSSALVQVVTGLGLHHVLRAWSTQLVLVLLSLNLCAAALRRLLAPSLSLATPSRADVAITEAAQSPAAPVRLEDALRAVLPGWSVRRLGEGHAVARKGLTLEGVAVACLGLLVLGVAYVVSATSGSRGLVKLMVGEPGDPAVHARFKVLREEGDAVVSWTPEPKFELGCGAVAAGDRNCWIDTVKGRSKTTLRPGDDLEFEGFRLTLVGVTRLPGAGAFDLDVFLAGEASTHLAQAGDVVDVERGGQRLATLMIAGDTTADPVGVVAGEKVPRERLSDLRVSARPRESLTFRLTTEEHVPWVWAGATLMLIGLGLTLGLPGYRVVAERVPSGHVSLVLCGTGALCRPARELDRVARALSAGKSLSA